MANKYALVSVSDKSNLNVIVNFYILRDILFLALEEHIDTFMIITKTCVNH